MKKLIFFFVMALTMLCASCYSEDSVGVPTTSATEIAVKTDSLASLQAKIAELNGQMQVQSPTTRGWLKRFLHRALADAVGALFGNLYGGLAGAVVGAASFSALACAVEVVNNEPNNANKSEESVKLDDKIAHCDLDEDLVPTDENCDESPIDSIGLYHNKVLIDVAVDEENEMSVSEYPNALLNAVRNNYPNLGEISSCDSVRIVTASSEFLEFEKEYKGGKDIDSYAEYIESKYPSKKGEIEILKEFFNGLPYAEASDMTSEYMNKVLKMIDDASLSADVKQNLRNGVIVGNASNRLWKLEDGAIVEE